MWMDRGVVLHSNNACIPTLSVPMPNNKGTRTCEALQKFVDSKNASRSIMIKKNFTLKNKGLMNVNYSNKARNKKICQATSPSYKEKIE